MITYKDVYEHFREEHLMYHGLKQPGNAYYYILLQCTFVLLLITFYYTNKYFYPKYDLV